MKKKTDDAPVIARRISEFLNDYAPQFLAGSEHTLKGYKDSLPLYFLFLQDKGVSPGNLSRCHLEKEWIEKWIIWLKEVRNNSPETCNNRLASLRRFLEFLAEKISAWRTYPKNRNGSSSRNVGKRRSVG